MVESVPARARRVVVLAGVLAGVCALLATFTPPPAHAERYCWGAYLPKLEATCRGRERYGSEVWGMGNEHSVCIAIAPYGPIKCSSGPKVWVSTYYGTNLLGQGWIQDNAPGGTYAYGEIF